MIYSSAHKCRVLFPNGDEQKVRTILVSPSYVSTTFGTFKKAEGRRWEWVADSDVKLIFD